MVSPWLLQYQIQQGILYSTTICHGFIQTRGMAIKYRKVNRNMIQGHVAESNKRELTEDMHDNWDTTYSANMLLPSNEFEGEKIDVTKNRHILRANFGSVQRIAELEQLFKDKYKHLAIHSVWIIEKSKENDGLHFWHREIWLRHKVTSTIVVDVGAIMRN
jgi:hypothetical protein